MVNANFQEAIEKLTKDGNYRNDLFNDVEKIKKEFNLSNEDLVAMQSYNPVMQTTTPRPTAMCCCCWQSDS